MNYYYVDKGRVFFEQIKQTDFAFPIEALLDKAFLQRFDQSLSNLLKQHDKIEKSLSDSVSGLRTQILESFKDLEA